jgi:hypothetical protein
MTEKASLITMTRSIFINDLPANMVVEDSISVSTINCSGNLFRHDRGSARKQDDEREDDCGPDASLRFERRYSAGNAVGDVGGNRGWRAVQCRSRNAGRAGLQPDA